MWYVQYNRVLTKYNSAMAQVAKIKTRREELFQLTQPKASKYSFASVRSSRKEHLFDEYLITIEREAIDRRQEAAEEIVSNYRVLLDLLEADIRKSHEQKDRIYRRKIIDQNSTEIIARLEGLSTSQVYRLLQEIKDSCGAPL